METQFMQEEAEEPPSGRFFLSGAAQTVADEAVPVEKKWRDIIEFRSTYFPLATDKEWNDWHWQLKNRITDFATISRILNLSHHETLAFQHRRGLPFSVTPYYASLLDPENSSQPIRRSVVPVVDEFIVHPEESIDPLGEDGHSPVHGLVHRYPDRALFLVTSFCSVFCRYCTRSRIVGKRQRNGLGCEQWEQAIAYIEKTPEIRDVLLSGGDPLTLPDSKLDWLLTRLRKIPHVEVIRIGTKAPMVLPQRITPALVKMLKKHHPLWMSIHATHPDELTPEAGLACRRLADAGIPLGSQTVLLSGINDDPAVMKKLMQGLMRFRVKPYYLYQCDPVVGSAHFRTSVAKGLSIYQSLRGHTSGYAVPTYVIDAPAGGGKIPLLPETVTGWDGNDILLKNYEGKIFRYPAAGGTCPLGQAREAIK